MMAKAWNDFLFGLFMGMGLIVAYGVLMLLVKIIVAITSSGGIHIG